MNGFFNGFILKNNKWLNDRTEGFFVSICLKGSWLNPSSLICCLNPCCCCVVVLVVWQWREKLCRRGRSLAGSTCTWRRSVWLTERLSPPQVTKTFQIQSEVVLFTLIDWWTDWWFLLNLLPLSLYRPSQCDPPLEVHDLFQDVQDGHVLMALLEELSGCKLVRPSLRHCDWYRPPPPPSSSSLSSSSFQLHSFKKSSHRIFRLNNIAKVLSFLEQRNVSWYIHILCWVRVTLVCLLLRWSWSVSMPQTLQMDTRPSSWDSSGTSSSFFRWSVLCLSLTVGCVLDSVLEGHL